MSYKIYTSDDKKYIVLKHWGEINRELSMKRILKAHTLGAELEITRYLIDLTEARNVDSVTQSYTFAYEDLKKPSRINLSARAAMLVSPEDHSHDFVETVLRNTGHNVTLFRDRELAINHLLEELQDT